MRGSWLALLPLAKHRIWMEHQQVQAASASEVGDGGTRELVRGGGGLESYMSAKQHAMPELSVCMLELMYGICSADGRRSAGVPQVLYSAICMAFVL